MDGNTIPTNLVTIIPDASLYHFGVLTSNVHMAWMRIVCGRLKSDYRYSKDIVYNNFPWPTPTDAQKAAIEKTAQAILDARALYPDCSLADLYDEITMPTELRKAHQQNDKAVIIDKVPKISEVGWHEQLQIFIRYRPLFIADSLLLDKLHRNCYTMIIRRCLPCQSWPLCGHYYQDALQRYRSA